MVFCRSGKRLHGAHVSCLDNWYETGPGVVETHCPTCRQSGYTAVYRQRIAQGRPEAPEEEFSGRNSRALILQRDAENEATLQRQLGRNRLLYESAIPNTLGFIKLATLVNSGVEVVNDYTNRNANPAPAPVPWQFRDLIWVAGTPYFIVPAADELAAMSRRFGAVSNEAARKAYEAAE